MKEVYGKMKEVLCFDCDAILTESEGHTGLDGERYCDECFYERFRYCDHCGHVCDIDDVEDVVTDDRGRHDIYEYWCSDCVRDDAVRCEDCGQYYSEDCNVTMILNPHGSDYCVCSGCYKSGDYGCCDCCRGDFHINDLTNANGEWFCDNCYDDNNIIHDYHDGDRPLLWLGDSRWGRSTVAFFGVELEIAEGGESSENAKSIIEAGGHAADSDITVEYDGSLTKGFEIISTTATYDYHVNRYGWENMMKKAEKLGYTSHDSGCCGLHVHIDRRYLDGDKCEKFDFKTRHEPTEIISAIILINNKEWLKAFSRRRNFHYCEFPEIKPIAGWKFNPPKRLKHYCVDEIDDFLSAISSCSGFQGHNVALNFGNKDTIELRFNRGTLKFSTFKAVMQFSQMFADAVKICNAPQQACLINFRWFLNTARRRKYKEFINYLKERNILK